MTDPKPASKGLNGGIAALVIASAAAVVPRFEGTVLHTYRDPAPRAIVTACDGHTGPELRMGMTFTRQECSEILASDLQKHWDGIQPCIHVPVSPEEGTAYLDFAFNAGVKAFCSASLTRKLNAGDHLGACDGLLAWTMAGGKVLPGLVRRRQAEWQMCRKGLA